MRLMILAFIGLVACVPEPEDRQIDRMPAQTSCDAEALQHLIGQPVESFDFDALKQPVRVLPPGSVMTMDYRMDRLNVSLDEDGSITRLWCG